MKKASFIVAIFLGLSLASCDKEEIVSEGALPSAAGGYITTHFPDEKILQVKREKDFLEKAIFDVILTNNYELEFKQNGEASKVSGNGKRIPVSVITPEIILSYVEENFSENYVTAWEIESDRREEIEIKLDNGLELRFDKQGKFLRFED